MIGLRARVLCGLTGCLLAIGLLGGGCTDSGTPAAQAGSNADGERAQDLLISFNEEPGSKLLVSAKTPDGSEIAVFGDKDEQGRIQRISQIDLLLGGGGQTVSVALDERERPLRVEIYDKSEATFAYDVDAGTVRAEVVNSDGAISVTEVSDPAEQADAGDAEDARTAGRANLCRKLRALRRVLDEFFNCDAAAADPTLCGGSLERATALLRDLCSLDSVDVDGLATRFGDGPRPMPLGIRPHFTARPGPDGGTTVVLVAVVFGGARPYDQVEWSWLVGPEEVPVENLPAWTAVADLVVPGVYVFRAEVVGGGGHQDRAGIGGFYC